MTRNQNLPEHATKTGLRRLRYLFDIVVLVAAAVAIENALDRVYQPTDLRTGVVFDVVSKIPAFLMAWILLRLRGESLATVGLKRPRSWRQAWLVGFIVAATIFAVVLISEKLGYRRDLSAFSALQGNLELTTYQILYVLIGAGFYEEFMFRGFLFYGLAMVFNGSRVAWIVACVVQAALFGLAHAYQNPFGIAMTGTIGLVMGLLFVGCGRNLWAVIIGHGVYDAIRSMWFFFYGTPG